MSEHAPLGSPRFFRDHNLGIDSALTLFAMAQALATDAHIIVDVGCGRGAMVDADHGGRRIHDLRAAGRTVIGIDVDPAGHVNPVLDEFRQIEGGKWPLDTASVDMVHCDWVLEHVSDVDGFVGELTRVLRPGGAFVARTVSKHSLLSIGARAIPNVKHARVVASLQPGRAEQDVFPTVYLMNSRAALGSALNPAFDWAINFHPGLEQYATRWPKVRRAIAALEPRLPRRNQLVLIVAARKRLDR